MSNKHLITPEDVFALARNSSSSLNEKDVYVYIEEAENLDIKPTIGAALYLRLLNNAGSADDNAMLLNGGEYANGCCSDIATFAGIKKALAYYAYARIVKNGGRTATRYGFVEKRDDYSTQVDYRERLASSNDAGMIADSYMRETLTFIEVSGIFEEYKKCGRGMSNRRVTIRAVGE